jgi:hypothetical protein
MGGFLLSFISAAAFIAAWIFSFLFLKATSKGKLSFYINLTFFAVYTAGSWYGISEAHGWDGLGILIIWGGVAILHTLILFIVSLVIHKRRKAQMYNVQGTMNNVGDSLNANSSPGAGNIDLNDPIHQMKGIIIGLGLMHLYKLAASITFITYVFSERVFDRQMILYFFDLVFLPVVLIFLWQLKKIGPILLWVWLAQVLISLAFMIVNMLSSHFFMPVLTLIMLILKLALAGTLAYLVNKPGVRARFN